MGPGAVASCSGASNIEIGEPLLGAWGPGGVGWLEEPAHPEASSAMAPSRVRRLGGRRGESKRRRITLSAMLKPRLLLTLVCALGASSSFVLAGSANAAGVSAPVADCNTHGRLTHGYTVGQLRSALNTIAVDVNEYTACHDVLERALLADLHPVKGGTGSGGGSFLPTWLLIVLILLALGGGGLGVAALRQRRRDP